MKYLISKQNLEWLANLWIIMNGNKLARNAGFLILSAIALSSNAIQLIITGAFAVLGFQIPFPEAPWWIIVFFVACATILLVVDRVLPARVNPPNPLDISLFNEFQELITQSTRTFLHEHDFGTTWNNSRLEPIRTIANVWSDPRYEFQDREIQEASRSVVELARILENKVAQYSYPHNHLPNCQTTLTYADERTGVVQPQTLENIKQLNDTAHQLVGAIDNLIKIGRRKIPST